MRKWEGQDPTSATLHCRELLATAALEVRRRLLLVLVREHDDGRRVVGRVGVVRRRLGPLPHEHCVGQRVVAFAFRHFHFVSLLEFVEVVH